VTTIPILRAGTFRGRGIDRRGVQAIADAHDPAALRVPVMDGDCEIGEVKALRMDGDMLMAELSCDLPARPLVSAEVCLDRPVIRQLILLGVRPESDAADQPVIVEG
jgi:hypothetical protein